MENYNNTRLGYQDNENEESTNNQKLMLKKRSSLKPRSSIKDPYNRTEENPNKSFKRRITFTSNEESDGVQSPLRSPEKSYKEAKTHFVSEFVNNKGDYII